MSAVPKSIQELERQSGRDTAPEQAHRSQGLELVSLDEFVQKPSVSTHVAQIIPAQAFIVVFGPTKSGKTFAVGDLMMHAAHGLDWHGFRIRRRLRVAYLCGEGTNGFRVRLHAWLQHHDNIEEPGDFRILPRALSLPSYLNDVIAALKPFTPDVVITDTLNSYFGGGNENDTQDMTTFVQSVRLLIHEVGCSVVVIHHTGIGDPSRERGSIVLRGASDVVIQVGKDENGTGLVGFQVITGRDIEAMDQPLSLRLTRYETDWTDEDGEPMATCIVEAAGQPVNLPGRGSRPLGDAQSAVLAAARELAQKATPASNGEVLLARSEVAALAKERGTSRQSISSAWQPLQTRGYLRLIEPGSISMRSSR